MSSELNLVCWKCGASLGVLSLPLRRLEVCPECDLELHICRMCMFYNPNISDQCTEEGAEEVRDKERANFCDYYKPRSGAYQVCDSPQAKTVKSELNALFEGSSEEEFEADDSSGSPNKALQDLFD